MSKKKRTGIRSAGKRLTVLISRSLSREIPEAAIKRPPTIEISVMKLALKKLADRYLATS